MKANNNGCVFYHLALHHLCSLVNYGKKAFLCIFITIHIFILIISDKSILVQWEILEVFIPSLFIVMFSKKSQGIPTIFHQISEKWLLYFCL